MSLRLGLYALLAVALLGGYWAYHAHVEALGAAKVEARDAKALAAQRLQEVATLKHEAQTNEDARSSLAAENARLLALAGPPPVVRLCNPSGHSQPAPTPSGVASGTGPTSSPGGGVSGVPTGVADQPDLGPALQQLALRADQLSAQVRALLLREQGMATSGTSPP